MNDESELIEALAASPLPDDAYADAVAEVRKLCRIRTSGERLLAAVLESSHHQPPVVARAVNDLWNALADDEEERDARLRRPRAA